MPRISEFYGIAIYIYPSDHVPPHFHAVYAEYEAEVDIRTGDLVDGRLPRRAHRLVREWARLHVDELMLNWARARRDQPLQKIAPLE